MKKLLISLSTLVLLLVSGCATSEISEERFTGEGESLSQLTKACDLNDGARCAALSFLYSEDSEYAEKDDKKVIQYSQKACDLNDGFGCSLVAAAYFDGRGVKKDFLIGEKYFQKSCDLKYGNGCYFLASLYHEGTIKEKNYLKASKYYHRACDLKVPAACTILGGMFHEGGDGIKKDRRKAISYLEKGCALNDVGGCVMLEALKFEEKEKKSK